MEEIFVAVSEALMKWLEHHQLWIKPLSLIVSPILAGVASYGTIKTRSRMDRQSKRLGMLKKTARIAEAEAIKRQGRVRELEKQILERKLRIDELETDLQRITDGGQQLWRLRDNRPFDKYKEWFLEPGAKVVTFGNLKGGVGKTTLAANFAAYLSRQKFRVLLVDLDYQGSLSNNLMLAAGYEEVESRADLLLQDGANLVTLERAKVHLTPAIDRGWLVPASYPFAQAESRLLMQWLLPLSGTDHEIDVRYRLAHALLRPEVRQSYDVIIFDMPPRMSIGSVNALVASHYFVVPTILDKLSIEAVGQFLSQMKAVKSDLGLGLEFAGVVASMTQMQNLTRRDHEMLDLVARSTNVWNADSNAILTRNLPKKAAIAAAAGEAVAYETRGADGNSIRQLFDPLYAELLTRIGLTPPPEHVKLLDELRAQRAASQPEADLV